MSTLNITQAGSSSKKLQEGQTTRQSSASRVFGAFQSRNRRKSRGRSDSQPSGLAKPSTPGELPFDTTSSNRCNGREVKEYKTKTTISSGNMETPSRKSFFRRKSISSRRQTLQTNLTEHIKEPISSRRHRSRNSDMHDFLRRKEISEPYNFQHVTHTSQGQFTSISQSNFRDLAAEFSMVNASQRPEKDLKGIRATCLYAKPSSKDGPLKTPTKSNTFLQSPKRRHRPSRNIHLQEPMPRNRRSLLAPTSSARSSMSATPDIPEPSSEIIDALIGMHSNEPTRAAVYSSPSDKQQEERLANLPRVDLVSALSGATLNDGSAKHGWSTPNLVSTTSTSPMYDTLAVERKAPSTAKSFETLPALAHGIPAGPIDKYNNICDGIHLGVTPPPGDDTPDSPVLPALIIPEQPSEPDFTHGIAVSDLASPFEAPDPGIGVALSTDDDGWRWEEDIDFCYENAGEPDINLNWWRKSLDPVQCFDFGQKLQQPADRDRDTDLASPVSLTDDDTTMPSTAPTSVVSSICGPRHLTPNTTNESTHAQDEAVSHDALKYTKESSGLGIVGQPVTEENVTLSRTSSTARKHRSSLSTFDSLPELVRSQSHIPPAEDALANNVKQAGKAPKSEKPLPLRSKEESVCKREKILSVQPSPPPPISLPPVPDSARSSQRKLASAHDYSRSEINLASLAQKAAQATPASAASPFKHGKNASIAQLETSSRRRAASIGRPGSQSRPQAKRRMSYSIFPTRDTVPTCAIPGKPLAPIPAGRPPVAQSVVRS